jgi:hypothetical protein
MDCPASEMNRLGRNCGDYSDLVAFDPATRPGNGITFLYGGNRYVPTSLETSDAANTVTWSNLDCTGSPANSGNICADLIFNDPRCVDPIFDECPQCSSFLRSGSGAHGSDEMLDAMGFDPGEEKQRTKQGGCCGQPTTED